MGRSRIRRSFYSPPKPAITSPAPGFSADYFADDTITFSGTCSVGETIEIRNGSTSYGVATNPTPTTFQLVRTIALGDVGAAPCVAVGSIGGTSDPVTGTFTADPARYPGLLSIFDPSRIYAGAGTWGRVMATQPVPDDWGFDNPARWTLSVANIAIVGSQAVCNPGLASTGQAYQNNAGIIVGNRLVTTIDIASTNGQTYVYQGGYSTIGAGLTGLQTVEYVPTAARLGVGGGAGHIGSVNAITATENKTIPQCYPRGGTLPDAWANGTATQQPWLATAAEQINGRAVVSFDGGADRLACGAAAAAFQPMSETSGVIGTILRPNAAAAADGYAISNNLVQVYWSATSKTWTISSPGMYSQDTAINSALAGQAHALTASWKANATGKVRLDAWSISPACGAGSGTVPTQTMKLGARGDAVTLFLKCDLAFALFATGDAALALEAKLQAWLRQESGT